jgi:hypothetical protein
MESQDSQHGSMIKAFDKLDAELNNKVNEDDFKAIVQLVLASSLCPDFKLSDPPTIEEVTEINEMVEGTFYTINGGNAVMIFRRPARSAKMRPWRPGKKPAWDKERYTLSTVETQS